MIGIVFPLLAGLALTTFGWLVPRRIARAPWRWHWVLLLDLTGPFGFFALLLAASARPIFAGVASLALFSGFALADATKRATLREPVVFSDMSEFIELFRHPRLYLPFAGTGIVIGGAAAIAILLLAIIGFEPALWPWTPLPGLFALTAVLVPAFILSRAPMLGVCAAVARSADPSAEPMSDAARLGPLASLVIYGAIARAERAARRARLGTPSPEIKRSRSDAPPIVLIQGESFFDARRLHDAIPPDLLPAFDRCRRTGVQSGRFGVSGWGAYTIRAEFAALTGVTDEALGYDRWNPYHAFARMPIPSLAWKLRGEGYRTVCLHPFDRRYYGRAKVLPMLGFDEFHGDEAFAGARRVGPYIADAEIARRAGELLAAEGPGLFLFIITMENHGPWLADDPRHHWPDPAPDLPAIPERDALRCLLHGLKSTDALLGAIQDKLCDGGVLALYGDHLPSLPRAFGALDFAYNDTDYVIWSRAGGTARRRDLKAHALPAALLGARAGFRLQPHGEARQ